MDQNVLRKIEWELQRRPEEYLHVALVSVDGTVLCYGVNERSCFKPVRACGGKRSKKAV
jgi:hypothetical protein